MAIIHVTTAQEFLDAIAHAGNEVYIDNDIDFNDHEFTQQSYVDGNVTVHGQGHNLSNIHYAYNGQKFYAGGNSYWDEVNFINCLCQNTADAAFFHGRDGSFNFDKCKFQGKFFNFVYRKANFTNCAFAFEDGLAWLSWSDGNSVSFEQCYFDFKEQSSGHTYITNSLNQTTVKNCYFKGTLKGQTVSPFTVGSNTFINNVINFDFVEGGGPFNLNYGGDPATVSIYNTTKAAGVTITPQSHIVGLPDSDMHVESAADVQRVSEAIAATGFPIVY